MVRLYDPFHVVNFISVPFPIKALYSRRSFREKFFLAESPFLIRVVSIEVMLQPIGMALPLLISFVWEDSLLSGMYRIPAKSMISTFDHPPPGEKRGRWVLSGILIEGKICWFGGRERKKRRKNKKKKKWGTTGTRCPCDGGEGINRFRGFNWRKQLQWFRRHGKRCDVAVMGLRLCGCCGRKGGVVVGDFGKAFWAQKGGRVTNSLRKEPSTATVRGHTTQLTTGCRLLMNQANLSPLSADL
jgi:hypothetical protein